MSCNVPDNQLWTWVLGEEEDAAQAAQLAQHVAGCAHCAERTAEYRTMVSDLADFEQLTPSVMPAAMPAADAVPGYRILRRLGQGGMGTVFEAEQHSPRRRVALKVISAGQFANDFQIRLFQREMQTLAHLNHAGIATIYNAGQTRDGQHYFAMELVDGQPLDQYVRAPDGRGTPLPIAERVELFQHICAAVSYAHQRGVIHRDLKPANILVTRDGQSKILDFGLARITDSDVPGSTAVTEPGRVMGTFAYMSPEQARGESAYIDVRADVYALGVILYELLTGVRPYDVTRCPIHEAVRIICERPPAALRSANRAVPPELETITLHALEKEPQRRYQSAGDLLDDITRYRTQHPILARPPSRVYRARKLLARHRLAFGLIALLAVLITGSAVTFAVQAYQIAQQRDEIAAERDRARTEASKFAEVNTALNNILTASNPWKRGDRDMLVRDVLDAAALRIETDLVANPLVAAAAHNALGNTYRGIGELAKAEHHLVKALALRRDHLPADNLEVAGSMNDLAELRADQRDLHAAERLYRQVLAIQQAHLPPDHPDIANTLNSIGLIRKWHDDLDAAEPLLQEALALRGAHVKRLAAQRGVSRPQLVDAYEAWAQTSNNLAALYRARATEASAAGDQAAADELLATATPLYRRALALREEWLGPDHPQTAKMHNNYAHLLADRGDMPGAVEHFHRAAAIFDEALGPGNSFSARTLLNLATRLFEAERFDDAAEVAADVLAITGDLPMEAQHVRQSAERLLEQIRTAQAQQETGRSDE